MPAEPRATRSAGIVVLAVLAIIAALYAGQELLVPLALAFLFTGLLRPLVRQFERAGLSAPIGSTVILVVFLGLAVVGFARLTFPVGAWVAEAGANGQPRPPPGASGHRNGAPTASGGSSAQGGSGGNGATIAALLFGTTPAVLGGCVEVLVLTCLLLASGDSFLAKLVRVLPL